MTTDSTDTTRPEATQGNDDEVRPASLMTRFVGMIFSPRATLERVAKAPRALGMLGLAIGVSALLNYGFLSTGVGQTALLQQQVRAIEDFGVVVSDTQYEQMEQSSRTFAAPMTAASMVVMIPLMTTVIAGVLYVIALVFLGATATFRQVFAVVAHGSAIVVLQQMFVVPLNYVRESMASPTTLASFAPMLEAGTFPMLFLSAVDVFLVWQVMVLSMGLAVVTQRRTMPIAIGLYFIYGVIAVGIAIVRGQFGS